MQLNPIQRVNNYRSDEGPDVVLLQQPIVLRSRSDYQRRFELLKKNPVILSGSPLKISPRPIPDRLNNTCKNNTMEDEEPEIISEVVRGHTRPEDLDPRANFFDDISGWQEENASFIFDNLVSYQYLIKCKEETQPLSASPPAIPKPLFRKKKKKLLVMPRDSGAEEDFSAASWNPSPSPPPSARLSLPSTPRTISANTKLLQAKRLSVHPATALSIKSPSIKSDLGNNISATESQSLGNIRMKLSHSASLRPSLSQSPTPTFQAHSDMGPAVVTGKKYCIDIQEAEGRKSLSSAQSTRAKTPSILPLIMSSSQKPRPPSAVWFVNGKTTKIHQKKSDQDQIDSTCTVPWLSDKASPRKFSAGGIKHARIQRGTSKHHIFDGGDLCIQPGTF